MALILPYQSTDGFKAIYGYPLTFLTTYNTIPRRILLSSISVNVIALLIDIVVVYFIMISISKLIHRIRIKDNMR